MTTTMRPATIIFFTGNGFRFDRIFWGGAAGLGAGVACFFLPPPKRPDRNPFFAGFCRGTAGRGARGWVVRKDSGDAFGAGGSYTGAWTGGTGRELSAGATMGVPHLLQNAESAKTRFPHFVQNTVPGTEELKDSCGAGTDRS